MNNLITTIEQQDLPCTSCGYNSGAFLMSHGLHFSKSGLNSQYSAGIEQTAHHKPRNTQSSINKKENPSIRLDLGLEKPKKLCEYSDGHHFSQCKEGREGTSAVEHLNGLKLDRHSWRIGKSERSTSLVDTEAEGGDGIRARETSLGDRGRCSLPPFPSLRSHVPNHGDWHKERVNTLINSNTGGGLRPSVQVGVNNLTEPISTLPQNLTIADWKPK